MAILVRPQGSRRVLKRALLPLMALAGSGCLVLEQIGWDFSGPSFSHETHVVGEEMECIDCHVDYEDSDATGVLDLEECLLCHEEVDQDLSADRRAGAFFVDGAYQLTNASELDPEITFSHLQHVTDEQGCADCHEAVIESDGVKSWMAVDMQQCMDCHTETGYSTACAACHQEIREDTAPESHAGAWDKQHGLTVRSCSGQTVDRCELCHTEATCVICHQEEMPENHTNHWRRRAHGLTARMDRENCAACHGPDYCDSCHQSAVPQNHTGLWGSSRNTHCYGCHVSDAEQSCFMCHHAGAPSHQLAPPQPPGHDPSSDCRSCHLLMTHVDNGDDCNRCHL